MINLSEIIYKYIFKAKTVPYDTNATLIVPDEQAYIACISRFELIDETGRVYVSREVDTLCFMLQDEGSTLKMMVTRRDHD